VDWVPWVVENHRRQMESLERLGDDSVPLAKLSTATHIFAQAFGAPVHVFEDSNPCALPLVQSAEEADRLEIPDLWSVRSLCRIFELGELVRRELGPETDFGICDMQTGFDIANLIWNKEDLLCAMALDPEPVKRLSAKCAQLLKTFLVELRKEFPTMSPCHCPGVWVPPELGPWVSADEIGALSTAMFEEFCLPELVDLSETFGSVAMHCCADAEHQFPSFRKIPGFYAFNRVQAKRGYLPLLEHFAGPDAPVHVLSWVPDDQMRRLVQESPAGTRFLFVRMAGPKDTYDDAARWLERVRAL
jgi:hypothetical protein